LARAVTTPLLPYFTVILAAGFVTAAALTYSFEATAEFAASAEINTANFKSRFVASAFAPAAAGDLDIARSVPVTPVAATVPVAAEPLPASAPSTEVASVQ
jgi:hypothetical protein